MKAQCVLLVKPVIHRVRMCALLTPPFHPLLSTLSQSPSFPLLPSSLNATWFLIIPSFLYSSLLPPSEALTFPLPPRMADALPSRAASRLCTFTSAPV